MSQKKQELDQSPEYWNEYTNIQFTKHMLIKKYLEGWLPKQTSYNGRVLYFDTHAGRGVYSTGESGSPLIAVKSLLNHFYRERIIQKTEIIYYFIERDQKNLMALKSEVENLGSLPKNVIIRCEEGESFKLLESILDTLDKEKSKMAPAFIFIDPYGFKVPGRILKRLMSHPGVELFINVIWRELDMGMRQREKLSSGLRNTLNEIFDNLDWESIANDEDFDSRAEKTVNLFREITNAKWATFVRMLGDNHKTRYMLVHLTNHPAGRDLIKDCLWSVCPDGGFMVRKDKDSAQSELLMTSGEIDTSGLESWLRIQLPLGTKKSWNELNELLRDELWRETHLWKLVSNLRKGKGLKFKVECLGRFSKDNNPTFSFEG